MKLIGMFFASICSGVLGGMGMGGGTLLIPVLTAFFGVEQGLAQTVNLVAFVPTAAFSLVLHVKNGLVKTKGLLPLSIFALVFSIGASFLQRLINENFRGKIFGLFLIVLSFFQVRELQKRGNKPENATFYTKNKNSRRSRKTNKSL